MRAIAAGAVLAAAQAALPSSVPVVKIQGVKGPVDMPLLGIGTWQYNSALAANVTQTAFEVGYRHVDTAFVYQNQDGVGAALAATGLPRDQYFITTKIPGGLSAEETRQNLDQCLQLLKTDYVDLMLIHFPASFSGQGGPAGRKEEWLALEAWAKQGKARAIGVSHYCRRQIEDVLEVATVPIAVNQVQYHVGMGTAGPLATDDKDFMQEKGILYESFSPLCGPCNPPDNMELITGDLVTEIGRAHNKTGAQVALRWLVQQGIPVIPKSSKRAHIEEDGALFDFELTKDEMARLTAATSPAVGGGPSPTDSGDCSVGLADDAWTWFKTLMA